MYIDWPKNSSSPCRCRCQPLKLAGNRFTTSKWLHGHNSCSAETYGTTLLDLIHLDMDKCQQTWTLFWERFKKMRPSHEVFGRPGFDFSRCCGLLLARWWRPWTSQVSSACVGSSQHFGIRNTDKPQEQQGWCSQTELLEIHLGYTFSCWEFCQSPCIPWMKMPGQDDECDDGGFQSDVYEGLLNVVAKDLRHLFEHGIVNPLDGQRYFFCIVNVMGDWPFIQRAGHLARSFYNAAKHARAHRQQSPKGFATGAWQTVQDVFGKILKAFRHQWEPSMNTESPFITEPCLLQLPHMRNDPAELFSWDLFHTWHIGCGKTFLGTAIIVLATSCIFAGGVDKRLELLTERFQIWCDRMRLKPHIRKLSKENLSWPTTTSYPSGVLVKGAHNTCVEQMVHCWVAMRMRRKFVQTDFWPLPTDALFRLKNFWKGCAAMSCGYRPQLPWNRWLWTKFFDVVRERGERSLPKLQETFFHDAKPTQAAPHCMGSERCCQKIRFCTKSLWLGRPNRQRIILEDQAG